MERGGRKAATWRDGWSALSSGILQIGCLCVNAWCVVSFSPGGIVRPMLNAEESVSVWRKTALGCRASKTRFGARASLYFPYRKAQQGAFLKLSPCKANHLGDGKTSSL